MLEITVNGRKGSFPDGTTLLAACRKLGVDVPALCHDNRLRPAGSCRLCMVEVDGYPRPLTACNTPLQDGMVLHTHGPLIESARRTLLTLMAIGYPSGSIVRQPEKEFHRWLLHYHVANAAAHDCGNGALPEAPPYFQDATHPYIRADMSQCVSCDRCMRICEEVQGQGTWRARHRGDATRIVPDRGRTLLESSCVSCGACVDTCPTGALEDVSVLLHGAPECWTRTTCPYCGTGCELMVGTRQDKIVQIKPVLDAPVSKGHLCAKGRYAFGFVHAADRVTEPMIRLNGHWKTCTWDDAFQHLAERFDRIIHETGPGAIGVLGSSRGTNEENYLAQKFVRVVLGSNNIDCCARVCHAPTAEGMKRTIGTGAATNSFDDIERASTLLLCGCNPTENHPIVGARIQQAVRRGAELIVIDPREIDLCREAGVHLQLRPGTNVPLLNALAHVIVAEGWLDEEALRERVEDFGIFREFIRVWTPERAADITGVAAPLIVKAARLYALHKPSMCFHGLGLTEHAQGTEGVMGLVNLALLTGNFGTPGSGVNPLRGQNNVQGAAHMGCDPGYLPGYQPLDQGRERFESIWGVALPRSPGRNLMQMIDAAERGRLRALWSIGYDIASTNPESERTHNALAKLDLVVVQDLFLNELARQFGHLFLPACSSFEKDGTFMNSERRVQRVRRALNPEGHSKPDWEILCGAAAAMGFRSSFAYRSVEEIWNEIRALWDAGAGITYARLEVGGLQWPCPTQSHPGTAILHVDRFTHGPRAALQRLRYHPSAEKVSPAFPLLLTTGRTLQQFNAGTMTLRTPHKRLRPTDTLDVSPHDAQQLGLRDGQLARVRSRRGQIVMPARIDPRVKTGELFATFHSPEIALNRLTSPQRDAAVLTPEYKVVAVAVEAVEPAAPSSYTASSGCPGSHPADGAPPQPKPANRGSEPIRRPAPP